MTNEEIEELKGLAASMGLYDDKNPCKRAVILGKAIKELGQEREQTKWTPVGEGLPKNTFVRCHVTVEEDDMCQCPVSGYLHFYNQPQNQPAPGG